MHIVWLYYSVPLKHNILQKKARCMVCDSFQLLSQFFSLCFWFVYIFIYVSSSLLLFRCGVENFTHFQLQLSVFCLYLLVQIQCNFIFLHVLFLTIPFQLFFYLTTIFVLPFSIIFHQLCALLSSVQFIPLRSTHS